jgi:hypothetical protein
MDELRRDRDEWRRGDLEILSDARKAELRLLASVENERNRGKKYFLTARGWLRSRSGEMYQDWLNGEWLEMHHAYCRELNRASKGL